jgi:hypothetical protein
MNLETTKQLVKAVLGRIVFSPRLHRLLLSDSAVVVAFHSVNDDLTNDGLTCGVESFESYCSSLPTISSRSAEPFARRLAGGERRDGQRVITFDDGYRDNCEACSTDIEEARAAGHVPRTEEFIDTDFVLAWEQSLRPRLERVDLGERQVAAIEDQTNRDILQWFRNLPPVIRKNALRRVGASRLGASDSPNVTGI